MPASNCATYPWEELPLKKVPDPLQTVLRAYETAMSWLCMVHCNIVGPRRLTRRAGRSLVDSKVLRPEAQQLSGFPFLDLVRLFPALKLWACLPSRQDDQARQRSRRRKEEFRYIQCRWQAKGAYAFPLVLTKTQKISMFARAL